MSRRLFSVLPLLSLLLLLTLSSCFGDPAPSPPEAAPPAHRFDEPCERVAGVARTDVGAAGEGIATIAYELVRDGGLIALEARAPDETTLGSLEIRFDAEPGLSPIVTSSARYEEAGVAATQTVTATRVGDHARFTSVREVAGVRAWLWWSTDLDGAVVDATAAALTDAEPDADAGILRTLDGTFATLPLVRDGEQVVTQAEHDAFVAAHGLTVFSDDVTARRLDAILDDPGWQSEAGAHVLSCQASAAAAREEEIGLASNQVTQPLECVKGEDLLKLTIQLEGAFSVTNGVLGQWDKITAVVAAGVVTGSATGIVVGFILVSFVADKLASHVVKQHGADIIAAPAELWGDDEGADAVRSFYGPKGSSTGDPHLATHDGEAFDLQVAGELVLVRGTASRFELQARQGPRESASCPNVAFNDAIALQLGAHRVSYDPRRERALFVDGVDVDLVDGALVLDDGGRVTREGQALRFDAPTGETVIAWGTTSLAIFVHLPGERAGSYEGLLGNFDGETGNDFVAADGAVLAPPVSWDALHGPFADAWRVDDDSSLFDYEAGEGPSTFHVAGFPSGPTTLTSLDEDARAAAEVACATVENPTAFEDCVLDVACTGDADTFVPVHELRDPQRRADVTVPLSLDGWIQEGPLGNGTWQVSEDGRSVVQTVNGEPTFFVGPERYLGVRIDGTLRSGASDDDLIGFVFGYQSPSAADGDAETAVDAFVLTWKKLAQDVAPEGLRLLHVHGDLATDGVNPLFWSLTAADKVDVLAEDTGPGTGWRVRPSRFSLLYTAERIEVWLDGELRIALDAADSPRPFVSGRFGFFNYSQANTHYSDFVVGPPVAAPARADCTMVLDHTDGTAIVEDTTFGAHCTRYVVTGVRDLEVQQGVLTVLPGTTIEMDANRRLEVWEQGGLVAVGTPDAPIHIVGTEPVVGHWGGVTIESAHPANALQHVVVSDAGAPGFQLQPLGLVVTGTEAAPAAVSVDDTAFVRHGGPAVALHRYGSLRSFARNTFSACDDVLVELPVVRLHQLDGTTTFADATNALPFVRVTRDTITPPLPAGEVTWPRLDVPYRFVPGVHALAGAETVVVVEPGARLELDDAAIDVAAGALRAIGTATEPIVFTGAAPTAGAWRGLYFRSVHDDNRLEHVEVRYAGASGYQGQTAAVLVAGTSTQPGSLTLRESVVADTAGSAVLVQPGGALVEENNTFSDNSGGDVVTP